MEILKEESRGLRLQLIFNGRNARAIQTSSHGISHDDLHAVAAVGS